MGIKPEGTNPVIVPPDNVQSRWGAWEASIDVAGQQAGEVFAETHAIATSANTIATDAIEQSGKFLTAAENMRAEALEGIDPDDPTYALWAAWDLAERAQDQAATAMGEAILANDVAIQALTRKAALMSTIRYKSPYNGEHFRASWDGDRVSIAKVGEWVGDVAMFDGSTRILWSPTESSRSLTTTNDVVLFYQLKPGVARETTVRSGGRVLPNNSWVTLAEWKVPENTQISASGSLTWSNRTHLGSYGLRLTLDGVNATTGEVARGAPLFGHGPRSHQVSMRLRSATRGQVLRMEAYASHGNSINRSVRDVSLRAQWISASSADAPLDPPDSTVKITLGTGMQARDQFRAALENNGLHYSTVTEIPFQIELVGTGSAAEMFRDCSGLKSIPDLKSDGISDASYMFWNCSSLTDGSVKLIGKNPNVVTLNMITGSGLSVKPFYDSEGNPIPDDGEKDSLSVSVRSYYSSPNNLWSLGSQSGDTGIITSLSEPFIRFNVAVKCDRTVLINTRSYPAGTVFAAGEYLRPSDWGVTFTFTTA